VDIQESLLITVQRESAVLRASHLVSHGAFFISTWKRNVKMMLQKGTFTKSMLSIELFNHNVIPCAVVIVVSMIR